MKSLNFLTAPRFRRWLPTFAFVALTLGASIPLTAQTAPPHQGTVALEGTMKTFYRAVNVIVVTTIDGVEHLYHFAKDLVVHGGTGSGVDALEGLREGTTVVVHYTLEGAETTAQEIDRVGDEGLETTEGIVTRIDRQRKQIRVRYDNGRIETFRLTDRAVMERARDEAITGHGRVVIYYANEDGRKVAHFFKQISKP